MKKVLIILLLISIIINSYTKEETITEEEVKGVFISYIELGEYLKGKEIKESQKNIDKMIQNCKNNQINTIVLQVRSSCDAIYDSKIYPYSQYIRTEEIEPYDVLKYFLKKAHERKIKVIAWINPYRIRTDEKIERIEESSPAYPYIGTDTIYVNKGIYWNPAKEITTQFIIEGVKEVLEYKIDGLLFDDYFYPNDEIDQKDYEQYKETHKDISKQTYHLQIINEMIQKVHQECQRKKIEFGISPDGNIENNYQKNYADVKLWMSSKEYIDFIMPQIYYGFYNSTQGYRKVIKEWESMLTNDQIKFYVALAFYKVGREDDYAKDGRYEWIQNDNIIMREVLLSRNIKNYKGFVLFRYDSLFNQNHYTHTSINEMENLKKITK